MSNYQRQIEQDQNQQSWLEVTANLAQFMPEDGTHTYRDEETGKVFTTQGIVDDFKILSHGILVCEVVSDSVYIHNHELFDYLFI